jgi:uncharacterized protein YukE
MVTVSAVAEVQTMAQITLESLARRVAALEKGMAELSSQAIPGRWKDWQKAVGKFQPSEISEEVDAAGRRIREADRRKSKA